MVLRTPVTQFSFFHVTDRPPPRVISLATPSRHPSRSLCSQSPATCLSCTCLCLRVLPATAVTAPSPRALRTPTRSSNHAFNSIRGHSGCPAHCWVSAGAAVAQLGLGAEVRLFGAILRSTKANKYFFILATSTLLDSHDAARIPHTRDQMRPHHRESCTLLTHSAHPPIPAF